MTGATTAQDEVGEYLGAVRAALADLPAEERDDLLVEVEASIADAAAESDAPVTARLGPPEDFAAELRAAAGFHTPASPRAERDGFRELARRVARHPALRRISSLAHDLAPVWWIARGYAAVGILAVWLQTGWAERYPFVPRFNGSASLGVALVGLGVLFSVAVGLVMRRRGIKSHLATVANVALAVALWAVLVEVDKATWDSPPEAVFVQSPQVAGLAYDGRPVTNVYPYGRDGSLLHDVLLYDQAGSPLNLPGDKSLDPNRRFVRNKSGQLLLNVFPIRYFQPGTRRVAHPDAAPRVDVPVVVTAPVTDARSEARP